MTGINYMKGSDEGMRTKTGISSIILIILAASLFAIQVKASGGEESQME